MPKGDIMTLYNLYDSFKGFYSGIAVLYSLVCLGYIVQSRGIPSQCDFSSNILFSKKSVVLKKTVAILVHLFMVFVLLFGSRYFVVGILNCNDIRAMPDGQYCYYVKATNEKNKTYTLPANIYKYDDRYTVYNVYFNNDGYLYFKESCSDMKYGETNYGYDQKDREWQIELTNTKAYHPSVQETKIKWTWSDDFIRLICILSHIVVIIMHLADIPNNRESTA